MYIAPLTYDRFFKKVFENDFIAKSFLEDLLDVEITDFQKAKLNHRLTDDAALIKFDYRCKINGKYVIIDMQQWYKQDIVKRFYTCHCANTVVQLENMPWANIVSPTTSTTNDDVVEEDATVYEIENSKTHKDYNYVAPVMTIIWMVHDTLGFKNDLVKYALAPQVLFDLATDESLWQTDQMDALLTQRKMALTVLNNQKKDLPFLRKNQLIFAFQRNIVKNKKLKTRYFPWFDLAYKSLDPKNKKDDFTSYLEHPVLEEVIRRLEKIINAPGELDFIEKVRQYEAVQAAEKRKLEEDMAAKLAEERRKLEEDMATKLKAEKRKAEVTLQKLVVSLNQQGFSSIKIAKMLDIEEKMVQEIVNS